MEYILVNSLFSENLSSALFYWPVTSLNILRMKTEFGRRTFSSAAPQIWNQIPLAIRT